MWTRLQPINRYTREFMSRPRLQSLLVIAVALLAFGAMAATLDSGGIPSGNQSDEPPDSNVEPNSNGTGLGSSNSSLSWSMPTRTCPSLLTDPSVFAAFGGAVLVGGFAVYRWRGSALLSVVVSAPILIGTVTLCPSVLLNRIPVVSDTFSTIPSPLLIAASLVLAVGGAFAFLYIVTDEHESLEAEEEPLEESVDLSKVGEAAGDAANRIERQADVSNEVYRAWSEMVRHLHVSNPEATTPDEFESRAIEAGMDSQDVSELTRLFEEVRYGEQDPAERETRALTALRRIEEAYADTDSESSGGQK